MTVLPSWRPTTAEPPTATSSWPSKVVQHALGDRLVVGVGGQGAEHEDLGAVRGDQRADRRGWSSGRSPGRRRARPRAVGRPPATRARVGREAVRGVDDDHDAGARRRAGRRLDALDGPHRVGVVAGEASRRRRGSRRAVRRRTPATSTNRKTASRLRRGWELRKRDTRPDRRGALGSWSGVGEGEERGSGSSCLDSQRWVPLRSSCRGRHFASWPWAAYSRGGTPRAVRCGRGIHHPTRTPARLARHSRGDPVRGADAVRCTGVRRHVGPRGRLRRRGRRGAGAPLLRHQGRPVRGRTARAPRPARGAGTGRGRWPGRRGRAAGPDVPLGLGRRADPAAAAGPGPRHPRARRRAAGAATASCASCSARSASLSASTSPIGGWRWSPHS